MIFGHGDDLWSWCQFYNKCQFLKVFSSFEKFNPIAYGGGGFLSHTTILLAATMKPLKLWLSNFVISCFYLFATIEKILAKSIIQGGCYSHFLKRSHEKLET